MKIKIKMKRIKSKINIILSNKILRERVGKNISKKNSNKDKILKDFLNYFKKKKIK
jgi:hypothetical protein